MSTQRRLVVDLQSMSPHMRLPEDGVERLRDGAPEGWELVLIKSPTDSAGDGASGVSQEVLDAIGSAEAYFGFGVPAELVRAAPQLKWAHSASAGVGASITPTLRGSGVVLSNSAGVYGEPMADNVLAGVMYFVRGLDYAVGLKQERRWDQTPFVTGVAQMREIGSLAVLVVGAGGIGGAVARRFAALGSSCTGIRRRPQLGVPGGFDRVFGTDHLDAELPGADVLVISAPSTGASKMLISRERLELLPKGAIVVNVARGALLDYDALLGGLDSGHLRGAVLDVFPKEPLDAASPLWEHPKVLMTPHVSGVSPHHWERALALFLGNWRRWSQGEPLRNQVDLDAGY